MSGVCNKAHNFNMHRRGPNIGRQETTWLQPLRGCWVLCAQEPTGDEFSRQGPAVMSPLQEAGPRLGRVAKQGAWLYKPQQHRRSREDNRDSPQGFSLDFQKPNPRKPNKARSHQLVAFGMLMCFCSLLRRAQGLSPPGQGVGCSSAAGVERTNRRWK